MEVGLAGVSQTAVGAVSAQCPRYLSDSRSSI